MGLSAPSIFPHITNSEKGGWRTGWVVDPLAGWLPLLLDNWNEEIQNVKTKERNKECKEEREKERKKENVKIKIDKKKFRLYCFVAWRFVWFEINWNSECFRV